MLRALVAGGVFTELEDGRFAKDDAAAAAARPPRATWSSTSARRCTARSASCCTRSAPARQRIDAVFGARAARILCSRTRGRGELGGAHAARTLPSPPSRGLRRRAGRPEGSSMSAAGQAPSWPRYRVTDRNRRRTSRAAGMLDPAPGDLRNRGSPTAARTSSATSSRRSRQGATATCSRRPARLGDERCGASPGDAAAQRWIQPRRLLSSSCSSRSAWHRAARCSTPPCST